MDKFTHPGNLRKTGRAIRFGSFLLVLLCLAISVAGCTRRFFREKADKEVDQVLADKDRYPAWHIEQFHAYPDPRARFADPTDPDHPPMPPDDPAAHESGPYAQKAKNGVGLVGGTGYLEMLEAWDAENRLVKAEEDASKNKSAETPKSETFPGDVKETKPPGVPGTPTAQGCKRGRPFLINLPQSVELGLVNSREYQDRREDLYLTALPVTLERFAFSAQFFAMGQAIREWTGRNTPEGRHDRYRLSGNTGFTKLFSTGALLLFRIANQTVVELTGPFRGTISQSTLSLDLIQPLLRGGGRVVTLEPLTQVERNLLYEIRSFARFREEFYNYLAGGGDITGVPPPITRIGGVSLVPGIVSPSGGDIARPQVTAGASARLDLTTVTPAPSAGYLPTLLQGSVLYNDRQSVEAQEKILKLLDAIKEGGDISQLQVDQAEQQLLSFRNSVLQDETSFRLSLDQFKLQLGVPTDLPLELEDSPVRPLRKQVARYESTFSEFEAAREKASSFENPDEALKLRAKLRELFTNHSVVQETRFREQISGRWGQWEKLTGKEVDERLVSLGKERQDLLDRRVELEDKGEKLSEKDRLRLGELDFEFDLGNFEKRLRDYESQPWKAPGMEADRRKRQEAIRFRDVVNFFMLVLAEARNERLEQIRQGWPSLPKLCVQGKDILQTDLDEAETVVAQTALASRFDLMNQRAQLNDSWRQIAIFANGLLGSLNVEYHLDSFTPPLKARPLQFGGSGNRHQLIINGDLPLVRKLERNGYRAALMGYQRRRRFLMAYEDQILANVRQEVRQLRQLAESYKIQKRNIELAYYSVESSLDTFRAPPTPSTSPSITNNAGNAAALTLQLLQAQRSLPSAQNQLFTVWVNYLTVRIQLYLDLEMLPLDFRGVWIDDVVNCDCPPPERSQQPDPGTRPQGKEPNGGGSEVGVSPERSAQTREDPASHGPENEQSR